MLEKPLIELRVVVCSGPGVVTGFRVDGELDLVAGLFQGVDHGF